MNDNRLGERAVGVFLSHSSGDRRFANRLASDLRAAGARVWIDEAEIKVGESLLGKIRQGIDEMDYVAVVLTPSSVSSEWVKRELEIALNMEIERKRVTVLPLLVQECELPSFLRTKKYADFRKSRRYRTALAALCKAIGINVPTSKKVRGRSLRRTGQSPREGAPAPTNCPACNGPVRPVSIETMYSGDGGYISEEGFECWDCRKDFLLRNGRLQDVDVKGSVYPAWFTLPVMKETERLRAAKKQRDD
jgi:hypothetical protein